MQLELRHKQIWISKKPVDFRKSIDGLSAFISESLELKPTLDLFIFYNKKMDKLKCLCWDRNGFVLLYKRLETGRFKCCFKVKSGKLPLSESDFRGLLMGLDWQLMKSWPVLDYTQFS